MPLALQAKILRLLQEQTFERVGGNETIHTDVRLIASTHRDLRLRAAEDKFRPDLYYRLGVFTIHLPPLRERGDDLPMLVEHYLRRFSGELGREVREIAPEALARLRAYSWPGNIRELQSVLRQALLRASGAVLLPAFLPELSGVSAARAPITRDRTSRFDLERFIRQRLSPSDERSLGGDPSRGRSIADDARARVHPWQPSRCVAAPRNFEADDAGEAARARPTRRAFGRVDDEDAS